MSEELKPAGFLDRVRDLVPTPPSVPQPDSKTPGTIVIAPPPGKGSGLIEHLKWAIPTLVAIFSFAYSAYLEYATAEAKQQAIEAREESRKAKKEAEDATERTYQLYEMFSGKGNGKFAQINGVSVVRPEAKLAGKE